MKNNTRLPATIAALGLLGVALYPRISAAILPPAMRTDFMLGAVMGVFLGIEILGFLMLWKRKHTPLH